MFKAILPLEFDDGKIMYSAVLKMIEKASPVLSKMIHDNPKYRPFSTALPNRIHVLCPMLEQMIGGLNGIEIVEKLDYTELLKCNAERASTQFYFEKTFFRNWGNVNYPLPDPFSIITSWKQRWNELFPEKINVALPAATEKKRFPARVAYANIVTHSYQISSYPTFTVFTGNVRINPDASFTQEFYVLSRFAEFSGTGAKTTMGAGVTTIVEDD